MPMLLHAPTSNHALLPSLSTPNTRTTTTPCRAPSLPTTPSPTDARVSGGLLSLSPIPCAPRPATRQRRSTCTHALPLEGKYLLRQEDRPPPSRAGPNLLLGNIMRVSSMVCQVRLVAPAHWLPSLLPSPEPVALSHAPHRVCPAPPSMNQPAARCTKLTCGRLRSWSAALRRRARALRLAPAHSTRCQRVCRPQGACGEHEEQSRASQP